MARKVNNDIFLSLHEIAYLLRIGGWLPIDREGQVRWAYQGNPQVIAINYFILYAILTTSEGHVLVNDAYNQYITRLVYRGDILTCYAMKDQGIFDQFSMDIDSKGQLWVGCRSGSEQRSDARLHVVKMGFLIPN
ncbi:Hypothetical predicted protein [Mytilus galloprovincialis]|uniref:Uncharacterized protein n=1 Tax=Mytilus galloprovincialis TaxID=29158 RepID=A0A8B6F4T4_MYTGA|nr:Hypothetical predicted protein [Mytilus galloprovincialis]